MKQAWLVRPQIFSVGAIGTPAAKPSNQGVQRWENFFVLADIIGSGVSPQLAQYLLVAMTAFVASVIGGVAGYGTGLLLPPVLIPVIGPEAVVPVVSLSALITNASRMSTYWHDLDRSKLKSVTIIAAPFCIVGAYCYTLLSGPVVSVLIGVFLIVLVPLRSFLQKRHGQLRSRGLALASAGYGLLVGSTSGSGVVLISILLSAGLGGISVIATDAGISLILGLLKVVIFQSTGSLTAPLWLMALIIGCVAVPGTLLSKRLAGHFSGKVHIYILNTVVLLGGLLLVWEGIEHIVQLQNSGYDFF